MTDTAIAAPASPVAVPDADTLIRTVADGLKARQVVPYIGPGVFATLPDGTCPVPRSSAELVARLNAKVAAPGRIRSQLTAVAQFIETRRHRKTLETILTEIFRHEVPATPVHRFVASLPTPPLVVDVWYDDVMEKLLADRTGGTWGQIQGISHPQSTGEWTRSYAPDGTEVAGESAEGWDTVLYKPSGSVSPAGNFLISDSDFVEILTEIDIQTPIPNVVKHRRTGRGFLFLGCRFDQEIQRTFGRQIAKRSGEAHWAVIEGDLTRNEQRFLELHNIHRIDLPVDTAVERIAAAMTA